MTAPVFPAPESQPISEYNPMLTLEYVRDAPENKYMDRKSARVKPTDLAALLSAFANAEGGTVVIGITDKERSIEGIDGLSEASLNALRNAKRDCCKPMPDCREETVTVPQSDGTCRHLLLIHVQPSSERLIMTSTDSIYLRIGDKTREIKGDNIRQLEYSRSLRRYEDEVNQEAQLSDLNEQLLQTFRSKLHADRMTYEQILKARGLIKRKDGKEYLTNAAVLLFAKNIMQFYPNCRVRFLRFDGNKQEVGARYNVIKDENMDGCILDLLEQVPRFVRGQLRDFTRLNEQTGRFESIPEYPEFAWLEGIVNAITHREYAHEGAFITISMFNDRLEIKSPGKLPNIVTIENIRETRFSRNPTISRVLCDWGWVRELNEGVKRIYEDMHGFFLDAPQYAEPEQGVSLTLANNIVMRCIRQTGTIMKGVGPEMWQELDPLEKQILVLLSNFTTLRVSQLERLTDKSRPTLNRRLNHLEKDLKLVKCNATSEKDPKRSYLLDI